MAAAACTASPRNNTANNKDGSPQEMDPADDFATQPLMEEELSDDVTDASSQDMDVDAAQVNVSQRSTFSRTRNHDPKAERAGE